MSIIHMTDRERKFLELLDDTQASELRWMNRAIAAEAEVAAWIKENGQGGWIHALRVELARLRTALNKYSEQDMLLGAAPPATQEPDHD